MNHTPLRPLVAALAVLASQGLSCRRSEPQRNAAPVQAGPNALRNGVQQPGGAAPVLAIGVTEGRVKPPADKSNDDDERYRVRPEWYPNGQPQNPYPAGTMIPINPPTPGMQPVPMQPGMQPMPGNGAQPYPSMQPIPAPGQPGMPAMQPVQPMPGMQPGMQPGMPSMQPIPAPGQPGVPAMQPTQPMPGMQPGMPSMQPIPAPGGQPVAQPPQPGMDPGMAPPPPNGSPASQVFQGSLGPDGTRDREGRFEREHQVALRRGQRVIISLQSSAFDTLLRVVPPAGEAMENDDIAQSDLNSRLDFTAPIDGRYRIVVTSYQPGATGAYTAQVTAGEPGQGMVVVANNNTAPAPDAQVGAGGTLSANTPVNEYLSPGDPSSGGRYVRAYRLEGQPGAMVTLRLESSAFDPTLALVAPNGQRWNNDDTSQADTNSTIQVTLPAAGTYRVEVSSYRQGATGPFTLTARTAEAPRMGQNGVPTGNVAGRQGAGNMYGIFVGITDYGGRSNLFGCADDARQLAQAYLNAHLAGTAQFIVLTDAEATTGAVQQAFQQMAGRVGPNDVFMFFHSGHGNRRPSTDRNADPDGFVESIVLRDGEIDSHQMATMFDGIHADVNMLALDSCFSGGFERAFNDAPNRFGMYSSEEDVLSQVAQRFQAGGYLSYFLRRGVTEADRNHDSAVRAGELSQYLIDQYAQNRQSMQSEDGSGVETWQNVRVNRAGVAVNDMMWRFPTAQNAFAQQ
jgi:Caspase domain/Bacterial pre-peptidase C-terminal domain